MVYKLVAEKDQEMQTGEQEQVIGSDQELEAANANHFEHQSKPRSITPKMCDYCTTYLQNMCIKF